MFSLFLLNVYGFTWLLSWWSRDEPETDYPEKVSKPKIMEQCTLKKVSNLDKSATSFCPQVEAKAQDMFCNFVLSEKSERCWLVLASMALVQKQQTQIKWCWSGKSETAKCWHLNGTEQYRAEWDLSFFETRWVPLNLI